MRCAWRVPGAPAAEHATVSVRSPWGASGGDLHAREIREEIVSLGGLMAHVRRFPGGSTRVMMRGSSPVAQGTAGEGRKKT